MVNSIDEQAYINYVMKKLPDVQKGEVRKLKKGDSLWKLAKQELNNPKATNQEISEYMLLIAKLNKLETVEKMNNLKVNDEIYLPAVFSKQVKSVDKNQKTPTHAEVTFAKIKETLFNDKTIHISQAYPKSLNLYHVYQYYKDEKTGYISNYHPVISFNLDKNGKFKKGAFEGEENTYAYGFDYEVKRDGSVTSKGSIRRPKVGQINPKDMQIVMERLEDLSKYAILTY